jgi:hypothetical protein
VQDRKDQKGEIFGLTNLFAYQGESAVLKDIVNKLNISESRAGVRLTSLELDEDNPDDKLEDEEGQNVRQSFKSEPDNEDAAISQLAAEIIGDGGSPKGRKTAKGIPVDRAITAKKHDPIQAILSSVGVQYTHENSEVIGSSKVEAQLSKRAEEAADEGETQKGEAKVFFEESRSQAQTVVGMKEYGGVRYRYRPPEEIKRRIFCTMAKWAGSEDSVEFALVVEGWTQAERRDFLARFYRWRRDMLSREPDGKVEGDDKIGGEDGGKLMDEIESKSDDDNDEL